MSTGGYPVSSGDGHTSSASHAFNYPQQNSLMPPFAGAEIPLFQDLSGNAFSPSFSTDHSAQFIDPLHAESIVNHCISTRSPSLSSPPKKSQPHSQSQPAAYPSQAEYRPMDYQRMPSAGFVQSNTMMAPGGMGQPTGMVGGMQMGPPMTGGPLQQRPDASPAGMAEEGMNGQGRQIGVMHRQLSSPSVVGPQRTTNGCEQGPAQTQRSKSSHNLVAAKNDKRVQEQQQQQLSAPSSQGFMSPNYSPGPPVQNGNPLRMSSPMMSQMGMSPYAHQQLMQSPQMTNQQMVPQATTPTTPQPGGMPMMQQPSPYAQQQQQRPVPSPIHSQSLQQQQSMMAQQPMMHIQSPPAPSIAPPQNPQHARAVNAGMRSASMGSMPVGVPNNFPISRPNSMTLPQQPQRFTANGTPVHPNYVQALNTEMPPAFMSMQTPKQAHPYFDHDRRVLPFPYPSGQQVPPQDPREPDTFGYLPDSIHYKPEYDRRNHKPSDSAIYNMPSTSTAPAKAPPKKRGSGGGAANSKKARRTNAEDDSARFVQPYPPGGPQGPQMQRMMPQYQGFDPNMGFIPHPMHGQPQMMPGQGMMSLQHGQHPMMIQRQMSAPAYTTIPTSMHQQAPPPYVMRPPSGPGMNGGMPAMYDGQNADPSMRMPNGVMSTMDMNGQIQPSTSMGSPSVFTSVHQQQSQMMYRGPPQMSFAPTQTMQQNPGTPTSMGGPPMQQQQPPQHCAGCGREGRVRTKADASANNQDNPPPMIQCSGTANDACNKTYHQECSGLKKGAFDALSCSRHSAWMCNDCFGPHKNDPSPSPSMPQLNPPVVSQSQNHSINLPPLSSPQSVNPSEQSSTSQAISSSPSNQSFTIPSSPSSSSVYNPYAPRTLQPPPYPQQMLPPPYHQMPISSFLPHPTQPPKK